MNQRAVATKKKEDTQAKNLMEPAKDEGLEEGQNELISLLQNFIIMASKDRLEQISKKDGISARELEATDTSRNHPWSFSILVELGKMRIIFKCYFCTDAGMDLSNLSPNNGTEKISLENCHVLFGEFCNLVGGAIKFSFNEKFNCINLADNGRETKLGLPMKGGLNDFSFYPFSNLEKNINAYEKCWCLEWPNFSIICANLILIPQDFLKEMEKEMKEKNIVSLELDEGGDVELF